MRPARDLSVPGIGRPIVGVDREVVAIIGRGVGAVPGQDPVPGIVGGTAQYRRQIHSGEAAADPDDAAVGIPSAPLGAGSGVGQIAEICRRAGTTALNIVTVGDRGHPRIIIPSASLRAGSHVPGKDPGR